MAVNVDLVHESTLLGAVDSFLKELVHVRPSLVQDFTAILEGMAERWLDTNGINELTALPASWLNAYVNQAENPQQTLKVLNEFYLWATQAKLIAENPLLTA